LDDSFFENPFVKAHEATLFPLLQRIALKVYFLNTSSNTIKMIEAALLVESSFLKKLTEILNEDSEIHMGKKYLFTLSNEGSLKKQLVKYAEDLNLVKQHISKLENDFIDYLKKSDIPAEIKKIFLALLVKSLNR
jgi:hypothetical protein